MVAPADSRSRPGGHLVGVGVGPGDPGLVTRRAVSVLRSADRVVAPSAAIDSVGRAEAIARDVCPGLRAERLVFPMSAGGSPSARADAYEAAARSLLPWLDAGEELAFVTLGDPNVYSTFTALSRAVLDLRPAVSVSTVPGIMAFQALAAATGTVILEASERLALVAALDGHSVVEAALGDPEQAVVVYKGGRHLPRITEALSRTGRLDGSVMGELLGLPGERAGAMALEGHREAS